MKKHGRNDIIWSLTVFNFHLILSGQQDMTWARHILLLKCMGDVFDILAGKTQGNWLLGIFKTILNDNN